MGPLKLMNCDKAENMMAEKVASVKRLPVSCREQDEQFLQPSLSLFSSRLWTAGIPSTLWTFEPKTLRTAGDNYFTHCIYNVFNVSPQDKDVTFYSTKRQPVGIIQCYLSC